MLAGAKPDLDSAVAAIRTGDVDRLRRILEVSPNVARVRADGQRTLLHVATDWPGHFPNSVANIELLIDAGADVNARFVGTHSETPLHWAASSNDVQALDALLDRGANIDADGGVIGNGTALADAVAFGQWDAARRLVERGASVTLWQAAALGLMDRLEGQFTKSVTPSAAEIDNAFWCACHGGQQTTAAYLLAQGADPNKVGHDKLSPLDAAHRAGAAPLVEWLRTIGGRSAED